MPVLSKTHEMSPHLDTLIRSISEGDLQPEWTEAAGTGTRFAPDSEAFSILVI